MSEEMKFKNEYQNTFQEVHAPVDLSRKVMNMSNTKNKNKKISFVKKAAMVAALTLVVLVGGNGAVYAATGNSLFHTVMIYVNGKGYVANLEEQVDEDGNVYYSGTYEVEDGAESVFITNEAEITEDVTYEIQMNTVNVQEKDGKLYLVDGDMELDITEDLADGEASGAYEKDGVTYQYEVSGENGSWSISVMSGEE